LRPSGDQLFGLGLRSLPLTKTELCIVMWHHAPFARHERKPGKSEDSELASARLPGDLCLSAVGLLHSGKRETVL